MSPFALSDGSVRPELVEGPGSLGPRPRRWEWTFPSREERLPERSSPLVRGPQARARRMAAALLPGTPPAHARASPHTGRTPRPSEGVAARAERRSVVGSIAYYGFLARRVPPQRLLAAAARRAVRGARNLLV